MNAIYAAEYKKAGEWHFVRVKDSEEVGYFLTRGLAEAAALEASDCGEICVNVDLDGYLVPADGVPVFCSVCHHRPCECKKGATG